jgi:hypothetical protein
MTTQQFHASDPFPTAPYDDIALEGLTVPYAGQSRMRLTITSGMADAHIRIDRDATNLIAIDCCGSVAPRLGVSASELRVSWPATIGSWLRAALAGECRAVEIILHPAVEWTILIRGGRRRPHPDLRWRQRPRPAPPRQYRCCPHRQRRHLRPPPRRPGVRRHRRRRPPRHRPRPRGRPPLRPRAERRRQRPQRRCAVTSCPGPAPSHFIGIGRRPRR